MLHIYIELVVHVFVHVCMIEETFISSANHKHRDLTQISNQQYVLYYNTYILLVGSLCQVPVIMNILSLFIDTCPLKNNKIVIKTCEENFFYFDLLVLHHI